MSTTFTSNPTTESCRLIDFEEAEIRIGLLPNTFFLTVRGVQPCLNMKVRLVPLVYVDCPEFWGIEVVGCLPEGICLPAQGEYNVAIGLQGITGSQGIEVIGANRRQKFEVSGGCQRP